MRCVPGMDAMRTWHGCDACLAWMPDSGFVSLSAAAPRAIAIFLRQNAMEFLCSV